ncbi:pleckstrin domain-containing protein [Cavenderia fasciculata]|uniref:Pleckstrin domain-containing protein n=1 Tax=Cavenderia fasciculata TaxID=261658 RepID=F4PPN6_CACFS|nr:pleckstrin domain-containing protein [Cavenderia fasciculata]EGG22349.1 pleckstrin domain-containing protein [Cavenderia fasciculata]|eukprot:XP_004360200.1 pleckstrin domain-containing protein [Cavenderia fasciculata]
MAFSLVRDFKDNYRGILHTKNGAKTSFADHKSINFGNLANLSKRLKRKKIISHLVNLMNNNEQNTINNGFNVETKHLSLASNQTELQKELLSLEERQTTSGFKFGIVVCQPGQTSDNELFGNECGGQEYEEFLDLLGDRIELMGWQHYSAGLDVRNNSTGTHSLYTDYQGNEVMFHVSTMLPFDTRADSQQIERKRQIGNDICVVVFNQGKDIYNPNIITSQFNHIVIVVTVIDSETYQVSLSCKDGVALPIDPPIPFQGRVQKQEIRDWLLTKLINAEMHSLQAPSFSQKISRTRETLLKYFIEQYL